MAILDTSGGEVCPGLRWGRGSFFRSKSLSASFEPLLFQVMGPFANELITSKACMFFWKSRRLGLQLLTTHDCSLLRKPMWNHVCFSCFPLHKFCACVTHQGIKWKRWDISAHPLMVFFSPHCWFPVQIAWWVWRHFAVPTQRLFHWWTSFLYSYLLYIYEFIMMMIRLLLSQCKMCPEGHTNTGTFAWRVLHWLWSTIVVVQQTDLVSFSSCVNKKCLGL